MSVEKFSGTFSSYANGITCISTETIQLITNAEALGVYCYLASKPSTWVPNIKELMRHFAFGRDKAYKIIDYLMDMRVLTREVTRSDGKFAQYHYTVHMSQMTQYDQTPPFPDLPYTVLPEAVNQETYKEKNIQSLDCKKEKKKDLRSSCDDQAKAALQSEKKKNEDVLLQQFESFMRFYPKRVNKKRAWLVFKRINHTPEQVNLIISDITWRFKNKIWDLSQKQYIPSPDKYLKDERWLDERIIPTSKPTSFTQETARPHPPFVRSVNGELVFSNH